MKTPRAARAHSQASTRMAEFITSSPEETVTLGRKLAREISPPCLVLLVGELGSGKTTLAKGLVAGLGAAREEEVTSPSFTLVHDYGEGRAFHVDLYRVETAQELSTLGLDDLLARDAVVIVEWGEKLGDFARVPQVLVRFEHVAGDRRKITVEKPASECHS